MTRLLTNARLEDLRFQIKDLNATVKLSDAMVQDYVDTAKSLGYRARISVMPFGAGSTDAAEFGKLGVEAINMAGISFDISKFSEGLVYHTLMTLPNTSNRSWLRQLLKLSGTISEKRTASPDSASLAKTTLRSLICFLKPLAVQHNTSPVR